ncbi:protein gar2-like, partial [Trifolium medium]|nr:protein gar2-like [Trifolium medium]
LHNPLTDGETLGKVIQLETLNYGFTKTLQKKQNNATRLDAQNQAYVALVEKAMAAQKNVERMEKELQDSAEVSNCDRNIAEWES